MKKDNSKEKFSKKTAGQRGISILFAVMILSVVLAISLGVSIISTQQIKTLSDVGYSVIAFYAAENGIEQILASTTSPLGNIGTTTLTNGAKYKVNVTLGAGCPTGREPTCTIKSTGNYKNTQRAITITY